LVVLSNLLIEPSNDLLTTIDPLVPILPYKWAGLSLFLQEVNTLMKLPHTLCDLLGRLRVAQLLRSQWLCMKKLLEASVGEGAKQAWTNSLSSKTRKNMQFRVSVNQMLYLWAVDTQQKFAKTC
jgi:hypothetical protein